jgi:hypothetical protein
MFTSTCLVQHVTCIFTKEVDLKFLCRV